MQMSIQVPDNLPAQRIYQRIRELEESLKEEAKFINALTGKVQASESAADDPWANPNTELPMTDAGIADFALNHDHYLYGTPKLP
jgi:hypothetical protein